MKSNKKSGAIEFVSQDQKERDLHAVLKDVRKKHAGKKHADLKDADVKELVMAIAKYLKIL